MKIDKEKFLNDLQMVKAGLSSKELLEQSNCFVFKDGYVFTFNDEVACRKQTELKLEGAVTAGPLMELLEKIPDKTLEVLNNDRGELEFRSKSERFAINRDAQVILPIEKVTEETPKAWAVLPANFGQIIDKVKDCVSTDEANNWSLTCVHLAPGYIEACDNKQIIRWHISLGNKKSLLVRGSAIEKLTGLGVTHVAPTPSWIHFKNAQGLIFSCRKFVEEYPPGMDEALAVEGSKIVLPKAAIEVSDRAAVVAGDLLPGADATLNITLWPGHMNVEGRGITGWYQGIKKCAYQGPKIQFVLSPKLLQHICQHYNDAVITNRKLKATGGSKDKNGYWEYVTLLGKPRQAHASPTTSPKKVKAGAGAEVDEDDISF